MTVLNNSNKKQLILFATLTVIVLVLAVSIVMEKDNNLQKKHIQTVSESKKKTIQRERAVKQSKITTNSNQFIEQEGVFEESNSNNTYVINAIETLKKLSGSTLKADLDTIHQIQQHLLDSAKNNQSVLNLLINEFKANLDNTFVKNSLMQILAEIKDPSTEKLGRELALSKDNNTCLAGLELLGNLQIPSKETLDLAKDIMVSDNSTSEITLAAISALPRMPLPTEENNDLIDNLYKLSKSEDEAVRSASILAIADYAKSSSQLETVLDAFDSDIPDDVISAAMAIERSNIVSDKLKNVLLENLSNENMPWEVRIMAANSLNRFDLNQEEFQTVKEFKSNIPLNAN